MGNIQEANDEEEDEATIAKQDLKKAFDTVEQSTIWSSLLEQGVSEGYEF